MTKAGCVVVLVMMAAACAKPTPTVYCYQMFETWPAIRDGELVAKQVTVWRDQYGRRCLNPPPLAESPQ